MTKEKPGGLTKHKDQWINKKGQKVKIIIMQFCHYFKLTNK